jgi:hypothetical protein
MARAAALGAKVQCLSQVVICIPSFSMECMDIRKFLRVLLQLAKIVMPLFSLFPFTREHTHTYNHPPLWFIARFSHLLDGWFFSQLEWYIAVL